MFGFERTGNRKLITVSAEQGAALEMYFKHYDTLSPIMTLSKSEITRAKYRGYITEVPPNDNR